jgi:hypothetical protein
VAKVLSYHSPLENLAAKPKPLRRLKLPEMSNSNSNSNSKKLEGKTGALQNTVLEKSHHSIPLVKLMPAIHDKITFRLPNGSKRRPRNAYFSIKK